MTEMTTRGTKGSELTHGELDANFARDVDVKTATYTTLVTDNRTTLECNHDFTPFTVTLGDAATMANADTSDYEVTITNVGAQDVTVSRAGSDTIDGVVTSIVLPQYSSITLKVNGTNDGYTSIARGLGVLADELITTVLDIGDWDMDANSGVSVAHGLDYTKLRSIFVMVRNDAGSPFPLNTDVNFNGQDGAVNANVTNVNLSRRAGGYFDSTSFDSTSYNRGWITILHSQ